MQALNSLFDITGQYDAFLCDLWGVIHDGEHLYPGVLETLERLHAAGKPLMFLSNAPRLAESVLAKMDKMGVRREWYCGALTSGEAAHRYLLEHHKWAVEGNSFLLGSYYYQGLESDAALLAGLPQQRVRNIEEADFILNGNFTFHGQPLEELLPELKKAAGKGIPMLCINPDLEVVKLDGTRIQCAGFIAAEYENRGGRVGSIGKPHPLVFEMAITELAEILQTEQGEVRSGRGSEALGAKAPSKIAMIGDNLLTDILGGKQAGLDTILVTQGVLKQESAEAYCRKAQILPDYLLTHFA